MVTRKLVPGQLLQPMLRGEEGINLDTSTPRSASFVLPAGDLFAIQVTGSGENFNHTDIQEAVTKNSNSPTQWNNMSRNQHFETV